MLEKFKRIWDPIDRVVFGLIRYVCVALLAALVVIVFYIFFGRYVLNDSPMWGEPLSLLLLTWMSILGSSMVVRTDEHLRVTIFDEKLGKTGVLITDILSTVLVFAFAIFLIKYGVQLMTQARNNMMGGIKIPYRYMYLSLPVTGVAYLFALVSQWVRRVGQ